MMSKAENNAPKSARKRWTSRVPVVAGIAIAVAVFLWLGKGIIENWAELSVHLSKASLWALIGAVGVLLCFILFIGLCYYNSLRLAGAKVSALAAISVYLASQLGKYVPGKVLYIAGQIGLAKWLRISITQSVLGFTAHHIQLVAMGMLVASPLLGILLKEGMILVLVIAAVAGFIILASGIWIRPFNAFQRRRGKPEMAAFSPVRALFSLLSAGIGWVSYAGIAAILIKALLPGLSVVTVVHVGIAAVAAWLLGFLSFITPVGMGVREGTFVLLTRTIIPEPTAMAVAVLMRLLHTGIQVPIGAIALAYLARSRPEEPAK